MTLFTLSLSLLWKTSRCGRPGSGTDTFLGPSFSESVVVSGAATNAANTVTLTLHTTPKKVIGQNVGGEFPWRGIVPRPHYFELFPLGAAATVTPAWTGLGCDWTLAQVDIKSAGCADETNR